MSFVSNLTNFVTGGANTNAASDLERAYNQIAGIDLPTAEQLKLGPLAEYVNAGQLDPALIAAALSSPSAYNNENISPASMGAMSDVLAQEGNIADAQGMTPQEKASIAQAEDAMSRNIAGQRGAIAQDFAGRGVPQSLIAAALENGTVGQNAQSGYLNALQAEGAASDRGLSALQNKGALASTMYGQESGQANAVAAAQDALNKFNATNSQQANIANQANRQSSNVYNTQNAQNVSNQNVAGKQQVQIQNQVNAPQQAAQLALERGQELLGIGKAQSDQQTAVGKQNAGVFSGALGGANSMLNSMMPAIPAAGGAPIPVAEGGEIPRDRIPATAFLRGGPVPGQAPVPGNSPRNDIVDAKLSPGEFVVPRDAMARPEIRSFLARNVPTPRPPSAHPSDVSSVLRALSMLREGNA